ncbi:Uncharacterised protein [Raoultella terrigena]|uniref:Uncharacterized protein n=1 Tax=Raoultella terrigena TaxID=577 RepID=A0A3P8M390_RAOTE|nr:Uncharacterised protein [Raoultella terrigena]
MPTAATPLSDRPISARMIRIPCQVVMTVDSRAQQEASTSAVTITFLRPMASEMGPVNSSPTASMAVEIDSEILLLAGEIPNSLDSTGRIGCTQ